MPSRILPAIALALMTMLLAAPAHATAFCNVPRTSDGFVALRAGPSADARLIARMRVGDEVMIGLERSGRWQQVTYWRGQTRHGDGGFALGRQGWMHQRFVGEECG